MIYFLIAIALVLLLTAIYISYQRYHDKKKFFISLGFLALLLVLSYSTKILLVYKPILILHIALLIMAWKHLFDTVRGKSFNIYWMLSPLISLFFFIMISLFFRENG